jgi:hypothetical protein
VKTQGTDCLTLTDPEESTGYANISLCHPEGLQRYTDTAKAQVAKAFGEQASQGKIERETITVAPEPGKKPGWWKRIFG